MLRPGPDQAETELLLQLHCSLAAFPPATGDLSALLEGVLGEVSALPAVGAQWVWLAQKNVPGFALKTHRGRPREGLARLDSFARSPDLKKVQRRFQDHPDPLPIPLHLVSDASRMTDWNETFLWPLACRARVVGFYGVQASAQGQLTPRVMQSLTAVARRLEGEVSIHQAERDGSGALFPSCRDLPEQKILERERELLITAIEQSDDSIIITDASGAIQYVNQAFSTLTGWPRSQALGANPRLLKSEFHDPDFYAGMWATLSRGDVWKGRVINRKKSGEPFTEQATITPVKDSDGAITHYVGVKRDVTAEVNFEDRLRQTQKMQALGMLAGGLAHDFNNILYAILGYCQLARDEVPAGHPARPSLDEIARAGNRAARLVTKMLTLGGRSEYEFRQMDLKEVVVEAMDLARASLPSSVECAMIMPGRPLGILGDPDQIHQAVLNLCTNAAYAMRRSGGTLKVTLEDVDFASPDPGLWPNLNPGRYRKLIFTDSGTGMDAATRERIFEPYFTTKEPDEGTGLGLATVQGVILNHQGRIFVTSTPGKGTSFTIFLPAVTLDRTDCRPAPECSDRIEGPGRIMLVDDEEMVVQVTGEGLKRGGFAIDGYTDSREALAAFDRDPAAVDLLITDQTMPYLTGLDLAAKVLTKRPDLPIILMTGFGEEGAAGAGDGVRVDLKLSKPFSISKIAEQAKQLLYRQNKKIEV